MLEKDLDIYDIRAEEAHNDKNALQTVIDGSLSFVMCRCD